MVGDERLAAASDTTPIVGTVAFSAALVASDYFAPAAALQAAALGFVIDIGFQVAFVLIANLRRSHRPSVGSQSSRERVLANPPHDLLRLAEVDFGVLFGNCRRPVAKQDSRDDKLSFLYEFYNGKLFSLAGLWES